MPAGLPIEIHEHIVRSVEDSGTLLQLALTCQAFKEIAINALWRSISEFSPFMKAMSSKGDLWDFDLRYHRDAEGHRRVSLYAPPIVLIRPIEEKDWKKFRHYATRIRHLWSDPHDAFEPRVFKQLSTFQPREPLFPKLKSLSIIADAKIVENSKGLTTLVGPSLSKLTIHVRSSSTWRHYRFHRLLLEWANCCPNVRHAWLSFEFPLGRQYGSTVESMVSHWKKLETFETDAGEITEALVRELGNLQHLRQCKLNEPGSHPEESPRPRPRRTPFLQQELFPALKDIEISGNSDWEFLSGFLASISSPIDSCQVADHNHDNIPLPFSIGNSFFRIFSRFTTLHTLHIDTRNFIMNQDSNDTSSAKILCHLFSLQRLKTVYLSTFMLTAVDDSFLLEISQAWKDLKDLTLTVPVRGFGELSDTPIRMTFQGLLPVFKDCSKLHKLEISCVCTPLNETHLQAFSGSIARLDSLLFTRSMLSGDPIAFATQIRELLPAINFYQKDFGYYREDQEQKKAWAKFHDVVNE